MSAHQIDVEVLYRLIEILDMLLALVERSEDHQNHYDLSSVDSEC